MKSLYQNNLFRWNDRSSKIKSYFSLIKYFGFIDVNRTVRKGETNNDKITRCNENSVTGTFVISYHSLSRNITFTTVYHDSSRF